MKKHIIGDKKLNNFVNHINHLKDDDCKFKRGDIITCDSKDDRRLVLCIFDGLCYFMHLTSSSFNDIFGNVYYINKGDISYQPIEVCSKYFSVVEI